MVPASRVRRRNPNRASAPAATAAVDPGAGGREPDPAGRTKGGLTSLCVPRPSLGHALTRWPIGRAAIVIGIVIGSGRRE